MHAQNSYIHPCGLKPFRQYLNQTSEPEHYLLGFTADRRVTVVDPDKWINETRERECWTAKRTFYGACMRVIHWNEIYTRRFKDGCGRMTGMEPKHYYVKFSDARRLLKEIDGAPEMIRAMFEGEAELIDNCLFAEVSKSDDFTQRCEARVKEQFSRADRLYTNLEIYRTDLVGKLQELKRNVDLKEVNPDRRAVIQTRLNTLEQAVSTISLPRPTSSRASSAAAPRHYAARNPSQYYASKMTMQNALLNSGDEFLQTFARSSRYKTLEVLVRADNVVKSEWLKIARVAAYLLGCKDSDAKVCAEALVAQGINRCVLLDPLLVEEAFSDDHSSPSQVTLDHLVKLVQKQGNIILPDWKSFVSR